MKLVFGLLSLFQFSSAWVPLSTRSITSLSVPSIASRNTVLFNVPPPSEADTEAFKEYISKQSPPASFFELQQDCIRSTKLAINDGHQLLEVEFPPLPAKVLELDDVSAYEVAQATLKLAVEFAKGFLVTAAAEEDDKASSSIKNIAILFPDESEARIAIEKLTGKDEVEPTTQVEAGVTISSLRRSEEGDDRVVKVG